MKRKVTKEEYNFLKKYSNIFSELIFIDEEHVFISPRDYRLLKDFFILAKYTHITEYDDVVGVVEKFKAKALTRNPYDNITCLLIFNNKEIVEKVIYFQSLI